MTTEEKRAKRAAYMWSWTRKNPDKKQEWDRKYREKHREQVLATKARWRERNREKIKADHKKWRDANKDKVDRSGKRARARFSERHPGYIGEYYRKNRHQIAYNVRKYKYGITKEQFDTMLVASGGRCESCGELLVGERRMVLDHDHTTNLARGILCHQCNSALGLLKDDSSRVYSLLKYIERFKAR